MKKKWFISLMPLLVVAVLLIGCGSTTEMTTAPAAVLPEEQPARSLTPVPSPEPIPTLKPEPMPEPQSLTPSVEKSTPIPSPQAIPWDEAKDHIGERATVRGPVVNTRYAHEVWGKPTFLHIGEPYPAPHRFTVVIWDENRNNFDKAPEHYYVGKTICVRGLIAEDKGVPQIEVKTPSQIQEQ